MEALGHVFSVGKTAKTPSGGDLFIDHTPIRPAFVLQRRGAPGRSHFQARAAPRRCKTKGQTQSITRSYKTGHP
jgi:hypothetical protein